MKWLKKFKKLRNARKKEDHRKKSLAHKINEYVDQEEAKTKEFIIKIVTANLAFEGHALEDKMEVIDIMTELCRFKILQDPEAVAMVTYDVNRESDGSPKLWYDV